MVCKFFKILILSALGIGVLPAHAQSIFDPALSINNQVISQYALNQRILYYQFINEIGDIEARARADLIDETLKRQAAQKVGLKISEEELKSGMENFAARGDLSLEELTARLNQEGISIDTFSSFIETNLLWIDLIRRRFASQADISQSEIDQAVSRLNGQVNLRVLLSEIVLPARPISNEQEKAILNAERLMEIKSVEEFSREAVRLSAAASARNGGRLDWIEMSQLPELLQPIIASMRPGDVTEPINVTNALLLFQLREIEEIGRAENATLAIEYSTITVDAAQVDDLILLLNTCRDFYAFANQLEDSNFENISLPPEEIPTQIILALAPLDENEIAILPAAQENRQQIVMLCGRTTEVNENISRAQVVSDLRQNRFASLAEGYLQDLRTTAKIIDY